MLKLVLGKQQACFPVLVRQQHLKMSRCLVRHEWHIVNSKTVPASAMPKPAPFAKLTSRLACFFFFFFFAFPQVSLLAKDKLFLCHSKYFNLSATRRECNREGPSQEFTHEGEWCKHIWTGRSQGVLVSFFSSGDRVDVDLEKETHKRSWWIF